MCAPSPSSSSSPIFVVVVVSDIRRFAFRAKKPQATTRRRASRASDRERTARPRATVATVTFFPRRRRARDVRAVASRRKQKSTRVERGPTPATVGASPDVHLNATRETRARAMSLLNDENIAPRNRRANDATPSAALAREDAPMKKTPRCDGTRFEI